MAVYNGERYLKPTIESTLNQTFKNFEFVIVNDASTDRTKEIINSYGDPRIKLYNNDKNIGQTKSLNVGLNISKGKYIARIDAGDVSMPKRLEKQLAFMEKNKEIAVLGTSAFRYDESGRIIRVVIMPRSSRSIMQSIFFSKASPLVHISVLMRRKTILKVGGYDENYQVLADYKLWSTLLQNNYQISNMREILVGYLISPDSFGNKNITGRSMTEACQVMRSNINKFTRLSISSEEARNIYKLFTLNLDKMALKDIISTEKLFFEILKDVNSPKSEIHFFLIREYINYILHNKKKKDKVIFQYAAKSIVTKFDGLFSVEKLSDSLLQLFLSIIWRNKSCYKNLVAEGEGDD